MSQVIEAVDKEIKKKTVKQVFPRYHQLDVVETLNEYTVSKKAAMMVEHFHEHVCVFR